MQLVWVAAHRDCRRSPPPPASTTTRCFAGELGRPDARALRLQAGGARPRPRRLPPDPGAPVAVVDAAGRDVRGRRRAAAAGVPRPRRRRVPRRSSRSARSSTSPSPRATTSRPRCRWSTWASCAGCRPPTWRARRRSTTGSPSSWRATRTRRVGFEVLRERAAVGYRSEHYEAPRAGPPYPKMLAALWRESPVPRLAPGERLATMASLLHVDRDGRSLAARADRALGADARRRGCATTSTPTCARCCTASTPTTSCSCRTART